MIELQLSLLSELERITLWKRKKQHLGCRQQDDVGDHPLVSNQVGGEEPRSAKEEFMMMVITMERHNMKMDCQKMTMMANCRWLWWRRCWWWWWGWCWWISDGDRRARLTWSSAKRMEEEEWARMFSGKLTLSDWFLSHRKKGFVYFWNSISHI